jgi:hypothetical protein
MENGGRNPISEIAPVITNRVALPFSPIDFEIELSATEIWHPP